MISPSKVTRGVISMFTPPPALPLADAALTIRGEDLRAVTIPWDDIARVTRVDLRAALICQIFNWHEHVDWGGIRLADFLDEFGPVTHPEGYYAFYSADGEFFETLSRDEARDPRVLLATTMNGRPLPHRYGGPVRLVVPFLQGYKSVKWLTRIDAYRHDPCGIKRLLGQSKTARLGQAWVDRLGIAPAAGRAGDP